MIGIHVVRLVCQFALMYKGRKIVCGTLLLVFIPRL